MMSVTDSRLAPSVSVEEAHRETFDFTTDTEALTFSLVSGIAHVNDIEKTAVSPISGTIDLDALNRLFESLPASDTASWFTFEHMGVQIAVSATGEALFVPASA